jgi:nucleotide-binding universal stress UspA family protein
MLRKLLVPLDGSTLSEKALPYAIKLAAKLDLDLTLLRVGRAPVFGEEIALSNFDYDSLETVEAYLSQVSDYLLDLKSEPVTFPLRLQTKALYGDPATEICRFAAEEEFDLVVMTTHGQPLDRGRSLGSVARDVLQNLAIPALMVRPLSQTSMGRPTLSELMACLNEPFARRFLEGWPRLLLPLDMTDKAEAALDLSLELARRLRATLYLLKVNNPVPQPRTLPGDLDTPAKSDPSGKAEANFYLQQIEKLAEERGVEVVKIVLVGNPETEIRSFADLFAPDALIMATHSVGTDLSAMSTPPSLTLEVMRRSHVPVFMVPLATRVAAPRPVEVAVR